MTRALVPPSPAALADWIAHSVGGQSLTAIAARRNSHKSTVWRRAARVEALDDCPAWSLVLDALSAAEMDRPGHLSTERTLGRACVALCDLQPPKARDALRDLGRIVTPAAAVLGLAANLPDAVIVAPAADAPPIRRPRGLVLAWLLLGWVESRDAQSPALARLTPTRDGARIMRDDRRVHPSARLGSLLRRGSIPPDLERTARDLVYDLEVAPAPTEARLRAALPAQSADLVCAMLRDGRPVEVIEREANMPARSAKHALALSLATLAKAPAPQGPRP